MVPKTQTAVTVPANRHVYVQYKVTNNTAITRTLTMVPIANVVQKVDESGACTAPFTLASGESCNLTLYIEGSSLTSNYYGGPVVCKTQTNTNTPDPFLCSQPEETAVLSINTVHAVPPTTHKLYVSNWTGNSISMCYLNAGNPEYCAVSGLSTSFANPEALAISGDMLFIANIGGGMSSCLMDPVTGDLSNCQIATNTQDAEQIFAPDGIAIAGSTAYISNSGPEQFHQGITVCTVSGAFLTNCNFIQANAAFSVPSDLAIVDGTVYVTNFNSQELQTTWCSVADPLCTTGNGTGVISGTGSLLNKPEGLIFATINATTYAYFTNEGNNKVVICTVNGPTSFSN
ncbi:MAG: hypothetical protein B7X00_01960, partial [Legionella sp. 21-45-4]